MSHPIQVKPTSPDREISCTPLFEYDFGLLSHFTAPPNVSLLCKLTMPSGLLSKRQTGGSWPPVRVSRIQDQAGMPPQPPGCGHHTYAVCSFIWDMRPMDRLSLKSFARCMPCFVVLFAKHGLKTGRGVGCSL